MKVSVNFGGWTPTKAALTVAGALMIGGAVGSALAVGPTVPAPIKWGGGWESLVEPTGSGTPVNAYVVPAGRNLMLTDVLATNFNGAATSFIHVYVGNGGNCQSPGNNRIRFAAVRANDSFEWSPRTGIGFASGQAVCVNAGTQLYVHLRGFHFTAAPTN